MLTRSRLRRWHVWLGWIVALPILFWTVSGVIMVIRPIEVVRGADLLRDAPPVQLSSPAIPPRVVGRPLTSMALAGTAAGPRWVIKFTDGGTRLADPATGRLLPPLSANDAVREVSARYTGTAKVKSVTATDPANPPLDLRRPIATWKVTMSDSTNFYVDSGSGEIVARRTGWWRFYDFMFGLHIMDLKTREDTSNPLVIGFGIAALVMSMLALVLLPMTINRRRRKPIRER
ncbi:MAG: PepSY domain-containing protein [Pseudomonadota bacterium]